MTFQYRTEVHDGIEFHILENEQTCERAEIIPSLGGTVAALVLQGGEKRLELLCFDSPLEIRENPLFRGRFLFPFNDRIPLGQYDFAGKTHQLPINSPHDGASIHGFLHRMPMAVVHTCVDDHSVEIRLRGVIAENDFPGYPFQIQIEIQFRLHSAGFDIAFDVLNPGASPCPFALGWHPYFRMGAGGARLRAACDRYVEVDADLLPTRRLLPTTGTPFDFADGRSLDGMAIDMGLHAPADGTIILERDGCAISISQDTALFPYTQLYIPDDGASIAIEPITAATNSFNFAELGLRVLAPGESARGSVGVRVRSCR